MSSAHRPTWDPAAAKKQIATRIYSSRDIAAHTRLKFRQPGQSRSNEVERRDLKLELLEAERKAAEKKAKGESVLGSVPAIEDAAPVKQPGDQEEEPEAKRRKLLLEQTRDEDADDVDDQDDTTVANGIDKGKGKAAAVESAEKNQDDDEDDDEDEDDDDGDDDEDETAELLRELEKIKRERAEERERQERERATSDALTREEEIALGNPLLNLQAALGNASPSPSLASNSSFGVKRRWDDDVIFKNQAQKDDKPKNEFVNDLVRTEFHKRFMKKFIA